MSEPFAFFEDQIASLTRYYGAPRDRIVIHEPDHVEEGFAAIEHALESGLHVAGYAGYEVGYVLEPRLANLLPGERRTPLLDFGVFGGFERETVPLPRASVPGSVSLTPLWDEAAYAGVFERAMDYIHAGDVYQVNLTFPMAGTVSGDPAAIYGALRQHQPVQYGGLVCLGEPTVMTLSPELFFATEGREISVRPMKGTARRGETPHEDAALAGAMRADEKSRAENLMIVDLLRNDLGRVSEIGSVRVTDLYSVETYPTLHQMTSGIVSRLRPDVGVTELFASLFPCGSVTGAPKIRAMEIIRELETSPRGAYCGAIGYIEPGEVACFNVAIRTMSVFGDGSAIYNVGSAIVSDSRAPDEYQECLLKAKIMTMNKDKNP